MGKPISFTINGEPRIVTTDPERPLLEVLREDLRLTGTKYGCGEGQCGACTVLVDGRSTRSCVTPVGDISGKAVLTIEGLATEEKLHRVQEAFLAEVAFQCGYCTPGMIMGAVELLGQQPNPTEAQIVSGMAGHICRCGGYSRILKAIKQAADSRR